MAFPVTGSPDHSGVMVPTIWSGKMLVKFYEASVVPAISNTDYEGEIKSHGDTVKIRTTPDITISNYTVGTSLSTEEPVPTTVDLLIDQGKYWSFISDDVNVAQADYKFVDDWARDASEQMKIAVDTDVLAALDAGAHADNQGTTAGTRSGSFDLGTTAAAETIDKTNVLNYIVDCGTVLDEQDVPENDRWMVIPPWFAGLIKQSDLKDASLAGDGTSIMRNGRLGMIDRFTLYLSNLVETVADTGTKYNVPFGQRHALTFASQFVKNESLRAETRFGTIYRGLKVYGFKVVKPEALGILYCNK